jgi:hypothetical protein
LRNIRIIKTGIDVSGILKDLRDNKKDWGAVRKKDGAHTIIDDFGYDELDVGIFQLIVGGVEKEGDFVGNSEICIPTPALYKQKSIIDFLKHNFNGRVSRCGFLSLEVGGEVGLHIDEGTYYLTKDRYHLSIQGTYDYTVGGETVRVEPGTLLWFNNKLLHGAKNVGNGVRITFVFDVPHSPNNL